MTGGGPDRGDAVYSSPMYYFAYLATLEGVPVVFSGGNSGPGWYQVSNAVPWVFTVGASSIDRKLRGDLVLGDGTVLTGVSGSGSQKNMFILVDFSNIFLPVNPGLFTSKSRNFRMGFKENVPFGPL